MTEANTPSPDEDRELIARLRRESNSVFPSRMRDGHAYHATAYALDKAADRLESLLSDRAKLEEALRSIACAIRLGAETDVLAWANLADAHKHIAKDAINRSTDRG